MKSCLGEVSVLSVLELLILCKVGGGIIAVYKRSVGDRARGAEGSACPPFVDSRDLVFAAALFADFFNREGDLDNTFVVIHV